MKLLHTKAALRKKVKKLKHLIMNIKTIQEQNDDLKRQYIVNYLIEKGFKNLNLKKNLLSGAEELCLSEINDAIQVFS